MIRTWLCVLSGLTASAPCAFAQVSVPCDPGLRSPAQSPYANGPRGDRCEGVYVKQVGGTVLAIASLTSSFEKYAPDSIKELHFTWSAPSDSGLYIRVRGVQPNLYYGMDAMRPGGTSRYTWPATILSSLKISQQDIGALAWTRRSIGGALRPVYVPLQSRDRIRSLKARNIAWFCFQE